jgi:hypothetical protein
MGKKAMLLKPDPEAMDRSSNASLASTSLE